MSGLTPEVSFQHPVVEGGELADGLQGFVRAPVGLILFLWNRTPSGKRAKTSSAPKLSSSAVRELSWHLSCVAVHNYVIYLAML